MASPAEWVARNLEEHRSVERTLVVRGDCVEIDRRHRYPTVTVRVVNSSVELADLDRIGLNDVDAIVTIRREVPYSWEAKAEARHRGRDLYSNRELWKAVNSRRFLGSESSDVEYFVDRIGSHDKVRELERIGSRLFRVHRTPSLGSLLVYCADEYILSEDFVHEVLAECPEVQVIANLSSWNKITPEAAEEGNRRGCRVFDRAGIYQALYRHAKTIRDL